MPNFLNNGGFYGSGGNFETVWLAQGCRPASLYSDQSYQTPNAGAIPVVASFSEVQREAACSGASPAATASVTCSSQTNSNWSRASFGMSS